MKRTGPTKESTRKLIVLLEKHGKKTRERVWLDLAWAIKKPTRQRASANLWKIAKIAKNAPGKIYAVAGTVLAAGALEGKIDVAALKFSKEAREKILAEKGHAYSLPDLVEKKVNKSDILIVK